MEPTYSDIYAFLDEEPRAEDYFRSLPGYIQNQIRNRKRQLSSYESLVRMAEEAEKFF